MNAIITALAHSSTAMLLVLAMLVPRTTFSETLIPEPMRIDPAGSWTSLPMRSSVSAPADERVRDNLRWALSQLAKSHDLAWSVHDDAEPSILTFERLTTDELEQRFGHRGLQLASYQVKEAYLLHIEGGGILIEAATAQGELRALASLWQILAQGVREDGVRLGQQVIWDAPLFRWRGLMLDSARHMQSVDYILSLLDAMALHKLNVFHWHLTDDQAWRLEIKAWPRLAEVGGFRVPAGQAPVADIDPATGQARRYGGFYTHADVRRIVEHATLRGITVVPEVDVPGHATAAIAAYPWLGVDGFAPDDVPASWGIYHTVFNLEERTFGLLEDVLDEVVALFPGPFIHLGGDEVVTEQWESSERIAERMAELGIENLQGVQNYFVERLQGHLDRYERRVIGWDEILESDLPPHAAVMSWRGVDGAIEAAAKGHETVLSPAPTLYLDHVQSEDPAAPPGRGGVITTRDIYAFDPLPERLEDNRDRVLGVQANLWTEHVRTEDRAAYMTWPRAAALAEVAWSAPERRDFDDFSARLASHLPRLEELGIPFARDPQALTGASPPGPDNPLRREDRQLELCQAAIELVLEDDAPLTGPREAYRVDIMKPCWLWRDAPLAGIAKVRASVGQLPFNFEIGDLLDEVQVLVPPDGRAVMTVRRNDCDGPLLASLDLAPALDNPAATELPATRVAGGPETPPRADLCIQFQRPDLDPFWVIDWIELVPES
jgi:hexosaminidase